MPGEFLARATDSVRAALDPVEILRRNSIIPDPWQARVLRSSAKQILVVGSRQSGKSSVVACAGLHAVLYRRRSMVAIVSPSLRQSTEMFKKVLDLLGPFRAEFPLLGETQRELRFAHGGRLLALPADQGRIRGLSAVDTLLVDEGAEVKDELWFAISPMRAAVANSKTFAISSAGRPRGWFYGSFMDAGDAWQRFVVPAGLCPRIDPAFLVGERHNLGEAYFAREYECQFREDAGTVDPKDLLIRPGSALAGALDRAFGGSGDLPEALVP